MKKNVLILASLCILGLFTWQVQASTNSVRTSIINNINKDNVPHGYDEIVLQGTLMFGINPNSIEAGASDDAFYIGFNQIFGNVVNTDVQQVVIIPITSAASGSYTVELNNASGYADGEFNKN